MWRFVGLKLGQCRTAAKATFFVPALLLCNRLSKKLTATNGRESMDAREHGGFGRPSRPRCAEPSWCASQGPASINRDNSVAFQEQRVWSVCTDEREVVMWGPEGTRLAANYQPSASPEFRLSRVKRTVDGGLPVATGIWQHIDASVH
jgi:hypothetical protein